MERRARGASDAVIGPQCLFAVMESLRRKRLSAVGRSERGVARWVPVLGHDNMGETVHKCVDERLGTLDSTLEEWIGADEAKAPKELIRAAFDATREATRKRVEKAKEHFFLRPKKERDEVLQLS